MGICDENMVRLVPNDRDVEGILQVCYNGSWHNVCADDEWNDVDAQAVCRSLSLLSQGKNSFSVFLQ